jgi:MFS family permease
MRPFPLPRPRYFYGWNVVAATFVMALFSFGLGFYGLTVYVAMLQRLHGWSASAVSAPITVYYVIGALLTAVIGSVYERVGPRVVVTAGSVAMAGGVAALGVVTRAWHLYPVFLVMALGWGAMSGAAINVLVAPWFERRRGLAVSLAFNGATLGGVIVTPSMMYLVEVLGFARALVVAAVASIVIVGGVGIAILRRGPDVIGLAPDGDRVAATHATATAAIDTRWRREALVTWRFWSVSAPFALGLAAQVGVLTHLAPLVMPVLGAGGAARAVSTTTAAAVIGRLLTGVVVDRSSCRVIAAATLALQLLGVALLAAARSTSTAYAGCVLFGLGVGNLTTLPGLILAAEWPRERFATLVGLAVAINQLTFAFGPSLVGLVRDLTSGYAAALGACAMLQAIAAVLVLLGAGERRPTTSESATDPRRARPA